MSEQKTLKTLLSGIGKVKWEFDGNDLIGFKKGESLAFNPITAVAHSKRFGLFKNNMRDTVSAGLKLGFSRAFSLNVYEACKANTNRGYQQVLRGRLLKSL